jgi:hypothetical protein
MVIENLLVNWSFTRAKPRVGCISALKGSGVKSFVFEIVRTGLGANNM